MERINWIIRHPLYSSSYKRLEELEKDRIFCKHEMTHFLDVARIAHIQNLEKQLGLHKPVIYAAAILHDIGKFQQYEEKIPHEIASEKIAREILSLMPENLSFSSDEQEMILNAIRSHRKTTDNPSPLEKLLYQSDKASRNCFCCPARSDCNWPQTKMNMEIQI